jgi:hypothetical protein
MTNMDTGEPLRSIRERILSERLPGERFAAEALRTRRRWPEGARRRTSPRAGHSVTAGARRSQLVGTYGGWAHECGAQVGGNSLADYEVSQPEEIGYPSSRSSLMEVRSPSILGRAGADSHAVKERFMRLRSSRLLRPTGDRLTSVHVETTDRPRRVTDERLGSHRFLKLSINYSMAGKPLTLVYTWPDALKSVSGSHRAPADRAAGAGVRRDLHRVLGVTPATAPQRREWGGSGVAVADRRQPTVAVERFTRADPARAERPWSHGLRRGPPAGARDRVLLARVDPAIRNSSTGGGGRMTAPPPGAR